MKSVRENSDKKRQQPEVEMAETEASSRSTRATSKASAAEPASRAEQTTPQTKRGADGMSPSPAEEPVESWSYETVEGASDLTPIVGTNLRRLRLKRGLSLERLSKASGVSRAMLGQIELGQSTPTINVLWKIARALGVPFSGLITNRALGRATVLEAEKAKVLTSHDGSFSSRALFPFDEPRLVEFYELKLAPQSSEKADAHPPGTIENLVVTAGSLEMTVGADIHTLSVGDAILFEADVPHVYRNTGDEPCVMYLVMTYTEKNG